MCSPRRIEKPQAKGYMLWVLEAERQRREKELKQLEYVAIGVTLVSLVAIVCGLLYVLVR